MREVNYTDERGRKYKVKLPDGVSDDEAESGVPIGPPDVVDAIGLPEPLATRLHNAFYDKKMWNAAIVRKDPKLLFGLLQSVLKIDVHKIMEAFAELERN